MNLMEQASAQFNVALKVELTFIDKTIETLIIHGGNKS
jgi:hypothetical protein